MAPWRRAGQSQAPLSCAAPGHHASRAALARTLGLMGTTTELRRALKARFFPYALNRGFEVDAKNQPLSTTFRRKAGTRVEIFELQWDKYGAPRFAIHFGTCPAEGLHIDGKVFPPGEALPTWCPDSGSLQPRPGTSSRSWFRQDSTLFRRLFGQQAQREPATVVEELLALFPELEGYWASGKIGRHMRLWRPNAAHEAPNEA